MAEAEERLERGSDRRAHRVVVSVVGAVSRRDREATAAQLVVRPRVQELEQQELRTNQVTKVKARWDISASLLAGLGQVGTSRRSELTEGEMSKKGRGLQPRYMDYDLILGGRKLAFPSAFLINRFLQGQQTAYI